VTDGDIRRALLRSVSLEEPVEKIMNRSPHVSAPDETSAQRIKTMTALSIHQIPIVTAEGRLVGLELLESLVAETALHDNWVLLMAGGVGSRLRPLTEETPKPLLEVGGKPILETILERFVGQGFRRFYISVNYHADQVTAHFGDGKRWGAEIRYLHEADALGTAGPLGLIETPPPDPLLVMNGDLLTKVNFESLLAYHLENGADATMAVREYDFQVPFGVVSLDDYQIIDIEEKPVHHCFVNAGMYVINTDVLKSVEKRVYLDMPEFFRRLKEAGIKTSAFPVREYWLDIGRIDDFNQANIDFEKDFSA
jgi:NDP-sugar pyrophosphorylase family protein